MNKGQQTRQRMIDTAAQLFEHHGYAATGINQILADSDTPRGSFYFHFKGGKEELGMQVIEHHQAVFSDRMRHLFTQASTVLAGVEGVLDALAQQMAASGYQTGCPVTAIATEMAGHSSQLRHCAEVSYEAWIHLIVPRLIAEGHLADQAYSTTRALLCAIEGALILCRVYQHRGPLDDVKGQLKRLLTV